MNILSHIFSIVNTSTKPKKIWWLKITWVLYSKDHKRQENIIVYNDLFVQSKENNNKLVFLTIKGMVTAMQMSQNNLTFLSKSSHIKLILFWRFVFHKSLWFEEEKILMLYVSRASDKCYLQTLVIDLSKFSLLRFILPIQAIN